MSVPPDATSTRDSRIEGHLPVLDGIRGIAILAVIIVHVPGFEVYGPVERLVQLGMMFGWAGVDLFFVLSGFLITGILLQARGGPGYYRTFYVRRTLRIFPLFYGYCAVLFLVLPFWRGLGTPGSAELTAAAPWYLTYMMNVRVALANGWTGASVAGTAFFWSLCVEEQFYLIWPATVARLGLDGLARLCLVLVVVALLWRVAMVRSGHMFAAYVLLPSRMDGLAIGAWLAIVARQPGGLDRLAARAPYAGAGALACLAVIVARSGYAGWDGAWMVTLGITCTAITSAALLISVVAHQRSLAHRAVASRALRFFGRYAYGMYVLGGIAAVLLAVTPLVGLVPARAFGSALPHLFWELALQLATTTVLALLSWTILERPALALKRYFPYAPRHTMAARSGQTASPLSTP